MLALFSLCMNATNVSGDAPALGAFSDHADVGKTGKAGSVEFDSVQNTYVVAGGGENMWSTNDAMHFVWKQMSGDLALAADIHWFGTNGNPPTLTHSECLQR